jgi:hypothetical protein
MDRGEGALRMDLYVLLMKLRAGGSIVSSAACTASEILFARADHRMFVDKDGYGYVYRPSQVST